ncbi:DUF262 domain-containing protein [Paracoccus fontiphilus]|uniref:DUF262 domain-containing protein n=2 Tax=Paracoccus fontiphilus TaxID=1815556 RepID=A0ABV7IER8_9RHOB
MPPETVAQSRVVNDFLDRVPAASKKVQITVACTKAADIFRSLPPRRRQGQLGVVMYKPGGTIESALNEIAKNNYVLPAIQREFVWRPEQIERLFDSLLQGYPFGTFLFWKVDPETSGTFKFYDFVRHYHARDAAHCPELDTITNRPVAAVLDGQQRLTALNIGLRGSMAWRLKGKRRANALAYPKRILHLDLLGTAPQDESGTVYRFKFLEPKVAADDETTVWFQVPKILDMKSGTDRLSEIQKFGLQGEKLTQAFNLLEKLRQAICTEQTISYYEESSQDLNRVLNIFIRLNSGGTILSYSDLLLSVAVAQWKQLDARSEIHSLVDELNKIGAGFSFDHDFVLKAGLMLTDIASVGFKVENFTSANMNVLEQQWASIKNTLIKTVELASNFGFSNANLRAESSLLPIAYYLHCRNLPDSYRTSQKFAKDRAVVRTWLVRSLLKPSGIWGSGLDTLLTALREVIKKEGEAGFPADQLARRMAQRGKPLSFGEDEIEELLEMQYGDKRVLLLLSLLFPFVDMRNQFHVDHIFPISQFTKSKLSHLSLKKGEVEDLRWYANTIANLQLLEGQLNTEKHAKLPAAWLEEAFSKKGERKAYCDRHDLGNVPSEIKDFRKFADTRRAVFRAKLTEALSGSQNHRTAAE